VGGLEASERIGFIIDLSSQIVPMSSNSSQTTAPVTLPTDKELVLKVIPMPADSNANGDIFGGWVMAQVDLAGSVIPARLARGRIATVAVNEFLFKQAVKIGDLLSFYAEVKRIGTTSVTVHVEVYAQRLRQADEIVKVTDANLTYVAIDMEGKPRALPKV
jgi:acyl-CoA thioesterase YciA